MPFVKKRAPLKRRLIKRSKDKQQDRKIKTLMKAFKNEEVKIMFHTVNATLVNTQNTSTCLVTHITNTTQGDLGQGNLTTPTLTIRTGNQITLVGYDYRFAIDYNEIGSNYFRVIFAQYMGQWIDPTTMTGNEILQSHLPATDGSIGAYLSGYRADTVRQSKNQPNSKKNSWKILSDHKHYFPGNTVEGVEYGFNNQKRVFNIRKRFKNGITSSYVANTPSANHVYMFIYPGSDATANQNPFFTFWGQSFYRDE